MRDADENSRSSSVSEDAGWKLVEDYCRRFKRDRFLQPYLVPHLSHPSSSVDLVFRNPTRYRKFPMASEDISSDRKSRSASPDLDTNENLNVTTSPDSTKTSRKLEWDSMADIGYGKDSEKVSNPLSTMERMVLKGHLTKTLANDTLEDASMSLPVAQSTLLSSDSVECIQKSESIHVRVSSKRIKNKLIRKNLKNDKTKKNISLKNNLSLKNFYVDVDIHTKSDTKNGNLKMMTENIRTPDGSKLQTFKGKNLNRSLILNVTKTPDFVVKKDNTNLHISRVPPGKRDVQFDLNEDVFSAPDLEESSRCEEGISDVQNSEIDTDPQSSCTRDDSPTLTKDNEDLATTVDSFEYMPGSLLCDGRAESSSETRSSQDNQIKSNNSARSNGGLSQDDQSKSNNSAPSSSESSQPYPTTYRSSEKDLPTTYETSSPLKIETKNDVVDREILFKDMIEQFFKMAKTECKQVINIKSTESQTDSDLVRSKIMHTAGTSTSDTLERKEILKYSSSRSEKVSGNRNADSENATSISKERVPESKTQSSSTSSSYTISNKSNDDQKSLQMKKSHRKLSECIDYSILSQSYVETKERLKKINAEISNLLVEKIRIEKKYKEKTVIKNKLMQSDSNEAISSLHLNATTPDTSNNVSIPPLDLKSSSDERSSNIDESAKNDITNPGTSNHPKVTENRSGKDTTSSCTHSSMNLSVTSFEKNDISSLLKKIEKLDRNLIKYKRCKVMNLFVEDYKTLVKKYCDMKMAQSVKNDVLDHDVKSKTPQNVSSKSGDSTILSSDKQQSSKSEVNECDHTPYVSRNIDEIYEIKEVSRALSHQSTASSKHTVASEHPQVKPSADASLLGQLHNLIAKLDDRLQAIETINLITKKVPTHQSISVKESTHIESTSLKSKKCDFKTKSEEIKSSVDIKHSETVSDKIRIKCVCCGKHRCKKSSRKGRPTAIAYNLILQPSESILDESDAKFKRRSLEEVVVKIPKNKMTGKPFQPKSAPRYKTNVDTKENDDEISTDDQLKEFSSLTDDRSDKSNRDLPLQEIPMNKQKSLTVEEYLYQNRPKFIKDANKRTELLDNIKKIRNERVHKQRMMIEQIPLNKRHLNDIYRSLSDLNDENSRSHAKHILPEPRQIMRFTAERYKKLPEMVDEQNRIRKEKFMKANRLKAELYVKKLQREALKGVVNFTYDRDILPL